MKYQSLEHFYDAVKQQMREQCQSCGSCLEACPIFPHTACAAETSTVVAEKLMAVIAEGRFSPEAYEMAFSCNNCLQCRDECPSGLRPNNLMVSAALTMIGQGHAPPSGRARISLDNPYNIARLLAFLLREEPEPWFNEVPANPRRAEIVVFTSCMAHSGAPGQVRDLANILEAMKMDFVVLGGARYCCGGADIASGNLKRAEEHGRELIAAISAFQPRVAISMCPGCHNRLINLYPCLTTVPFVSQHITQFLMENLGRMNFTRPISQTVTMHDACVLGRVLNEFEAPRNLLRAIPGLKLVEMAHNRQNSLCCGGVAFYTHPQRASTLRRQRLEEARSSGAEIVATVCPTCQNVLSAAGPALGLEVASVASLLARGMGVDARDSFADVVFDNEKLKELVERNSQRLRSLNLEPGEVARRLSDYFADIS